MDAKTIHTIDVQVEIDLKELEPSPPQFLEVFRIEVTNFCSSTPEWDQRYIGILVYGQDD